MKWGDCMKRITLVAGILGLGLTLWMLSRFGAQAIFALVMTGGWGILAAIVFHAVQVSLSAQAWRIIARRDLPPHLPLRDFFMLRCVREGGKQPAPRGAGWWGGSGQPPVIPAGAGFAPRGSGDNL
jgi:hypothetical protein